MEVCDGVEAMVNSDENGTSGLGSNSLNALEKDTTILLSFQVMNKRCRIGSLALGGK